jgi:hypothetical protein
MRTTGENHQAFFLSHHHDQSVLEAIQPAGAALLDKEMPVSPG